MYDKTSTIEAGKERRVEIVEIAFSIVASALSIIATIVAFKSKKEVESLRDRYENNEHTAIGDGNAQIVGTGNQVNTHVRQ